MGLLDFLQKFLGGQRKGIQELSTILKIDPRQLSACPVQYHEFRIPKRSGGQRTLHAPNQELKAIQRLLLSRYFNHLHSHPAAHGFEKGKSIVTNALPHAAQAVVVRIDLKDFFPSNTASRAQAYFRWLGWDRLVCNLLVDLCTWKGALPQGAPTSPKLSNLINYTLDVRLAGLAKKYQAQYTRYADDLTFSFEKDSHQQVNQVVRYAKEILEDEGYRINMKKKLTVRRQHHQQRVTGLVVNQKVNLPRKQRRLIRAMEHRHANGQPITLSESQLIGWESVLYMVEKQTGRIT